MQIAAVNVDSTGFNGIGVFRIARVLTVIAGCMINATTAAANDIEWLFVDIVPVAVTDEGATITIGESIVGTATSAEYSLVAGTMAVIGDGGVGSGGVCTDASSCCDLNSDGIRDDGCQWCECDAGACNQLDVVFADVSGSFGSCDPDGFANIHDSNQVLGCFSGTSTCDSLNIDTGGAFGNCTPDGFCNIHDVNLVLAAFSGTTTCACPSGPMPEFPTEVQGVATLRIESRQHTVAPGSLFEVDAFIDGPVEALRSYQLHLAPSGGQRGLQLAPSRGQRGWIELIGISVENRKDAAFARTGSLTATNVETGQMLSGLEANEGVRVEDGSYLATYVYRMSKDAAGEFVIDTLAHDAGQTYLVGPNDGEIEIELTRPAVVTAKSTKRRGR
jgi:hypothetical protein